MLSSFASMIVRVFASFAFATALFTVGSIAVQAQQARNPDQGNLTITTPVAMSCVRYLNARQSEPVLPGARLTVVAGAIQIVAGGQVVYQIPAAVARAQLISRNGQRPGSDYQYATDRASTGTGFYWFETQYRAGVSAPDVLRNELFINGAGQVVSYSYYQSRQNPDPATGSRELTVRCEPAQ